MKLIIPLDERHQPTEYFGIKSGYYCGNKVVELLRHNKGNPEAIQFIADMLEQ